MSRLPRSSPSSKIWRTSRENPRGRLEADSSDCSEPPAPRGGSPSSRSNHHGVRTSKAHVSGSVSERLRGAVTGAPGPRGGGGASRWRRGLAVEVGPRGGGGAKTRPRRGRDAGGLKAIIRINTAVGLGGTRAESIAEILRGETKRKGDEEEGRRRGRETRRKGDEEEGRPRGREMKRKGDEEEGRPRGREMKSKGDEEERRPRGREMKSKGDEEERR
ncbi:hypothetical protein EYF80_066905 [Liparis tanakae]|uniref:Uncharacterized protein n=1 Tax=Liparis tanakae TaxID=230148 RepID=A0A4Z2E2P9_9TELE|nr:hypothetical protein EYF80_066905 [Liparis tanakae]